MNGEYMQYHISKNQIHVFQFEAGNIEKHTIIPISDSSEVSSVISNISANQSVVVSGDVSADNIPSNAQLLSPLALTPEYNLAVGLVLKGLGCTITTFDVLDATLQEKHEIGIYKSLVQRTVLFAGAFLLFLLLLPVAADMLFQNKIDALEEQRLSDPLYAQVAALESQVKTLERQHAERLGVQQRAHISRLMYTIGKIMPEKVWLYKLSIGKSKKSMTLSLHGYSNDPEQIMEFLKRLEREHCSPSLVRSGSELPAETAMIPAGGSFTTFEIKAIAEE
jgi:hypothetical protein